MQSWKYKHIKDETAIGFKERIIICIIVILILIGFLLNYKLSDSVKLSETQSIVTNEEKNLINDVLSGNEIDRSNFEKEYLDTIEKLKKYNITNNTEKLGKAYYLLGINSFKNNNYENALNYLNTSADYLKNTKNYYYILKNNECKINIYMAKSDYIDALKCGNEMYLLMEREDIKSLSNEEKAILEVKVLSSVLATTSKFKMDAVSDTVYKELTDISQQYEESYDNIYIYAKYKYNLNNGQYDEAKKYALEYIDYFKNSSDVKEECANFYLLEALIYMNDLDNIQEVFDKVEKGYSQMDNPVLDANLEALKGAYEEKKGNYAQSLTHYNDAMAKYEKLDYMIEANDIDEQILSLHNKVNIDLNYYLDKRVEFAKNNEYTKSLGKLTDSLVSILYSKNQEDSSIIKKENERINSITKTVKKINHVYFTIIIFLIYMTITLIRELNKRKEREYELREIVKTDYLTKAYSKQYTYRLIYKKIAEKSEFAVMMFDLDKFKNINDTYGHIVGDAVLVSMVNEIKGLLRRGDAIGRFGGEEFLLVISNVNDLENYMKAIQQAVKNIQWDIPELKVTISGGVSMSSGKEDVDDIISEADEKLYTAKNSGRDKIII